MIYKENKTKIKDSYIEFSENDLFDLYYRDKFDTINFAETNCKLNYEVKEKDLRSKFYLTLENIDNIREEVKNMNKNERTESLKSFLTENFDNKEVRKKLEDVVILNINSEIVKEKLELVAMKVDVKYVDIIDTDFNNIKENLEKCPFVTAFPNDYSFIKTEKGEEYILLKNNDDSFTALDKNYIKKMIEKYNEKDLYIDEPVEDNKEIADKFANTENDFRREQNFEFEL